MDLFDKQTIRISKRQVELLLKGIENTDYQELHAGDVMELNGIHLTLEAMQQVFNLKVQVMA